MNYVFNDMVIYDGNDNKTDFTEYEQCLKYHR